MPKGTAVKYCAGGGLAGPEIGVGVVHLHRAGAHGIEAFEGRDQFTGTEHLDVEAAIRHLADALGQVGRAAGAVHVERRALAVGAGHLPVEAGRLRVGDDGGTEHAAGNGGAGEELAADQGHGGTPVWGVENETRPFVRRRVEPFASPVPCAVGVQVLDLNDALDLIRWHACGFGACGRAPLVQPWMPNVGCDGPR